MNMTELATLINTIGLPFVNGIMKGDNNKQVPAAYIAYHAITANSIYADGEIVYYEGEIALSLITKDRNRTTELQIEAAMSGAGIDWDGPDYEYDANQDIHITTWYFQICDD